MEENFWQRVNTLLEVNDMTRKELAAFAKIDVSNIGKGMKDGNSPSAETAVKVAKYLHTTVEYLVTGTYSDDEKKALTEIDEVYKNLSLIKALNSIPEQSRKPIEFMITDMSDKYGKK